MDSALPRDTSAFSAFKVFFGPLSLLVSQPRPLWREVALS